MNISKNFIKSGIIDLAQPRLGTKILYKSDEFFGLANRIINPNRILWIITCFGILTYNRNNDTISQDAN